MRITFLIVALVASLSHAGAPEPARLRFVLTPYRPAPELKQAYRPLADRLAAALHQPVELIVADSFGAAADLLVSGRADIGELTPYAFVSGMQRSGGASGDHLAPLAADAMVGRPGTGVILVPVTSKVKSLDELKGARFGFVDEFSSTGFLGPWAMLQAKGLNPKTHFSAWSFLGSHNAVLEALLKGTVDAGAISRHTLDTLAGDKKLDVSKVRVVVETARMPGDVMCARPDFPAEQREVLEKTLLSLDWEKPGDRAVLEPTSRKAFNKVDVKDYAWLLRVAATVKAK